ncbi:hypothetical protein ACOMHN_052739 [Nucella lapillus]
MPVRTRQSAQEAGTKSERHVITGGGGFPGFSLGKKLAGDGHSVVLLDIKEPVWTMRSGMEFVQGDIRNYEDVEKAVKGADVVFHMASYGMSGREQLNKKLIEQVNIGGTEHVLRGLERVQFRREEIVLTLTLPCKVDPPTPGWSGRGPVFAHVVGAKYLANMFRCLQLCLSVIGVSARESGCILLLLAFSRRSMPV